MGIRTGFGAVVIGALFGLALWTPARPAAFTQPAFYDLPNNDADCPAGARQIPWKAGADLWNGGALPAYSAVRCTGLTEGDGTTDNTKAIQACLDGLQANRAALIPPGMYYVNGTISLPSHKALRGSGSTNGAQGRWLSATYHGDSGSGAACTTLKLGPNGAIRTAGSSHVQSHVALAGGYTKGSTSVVAAAAPGVAIGDWIIISEKQGDTDIPVSWTGQDGKATWCGVQNNSEYLMSQIVQVISLTGNTVGISRPLYYTFKAELNPRLYLLSIGAQRAGIEDLKLWGSVNTRAEPHIQVDGGIDCWVKNVETFNTPDAAKAYPVFMEYSYGCEIRDSYFHFGQGNGGDRNYGIGFLGPNSDHKVENNIYRENRHAFSQEGGGSGIVFLYNYIDDQYTNDLTSMGSPRANHGAHPYMTLFEGNVISRFVADDIWGTSSHMVLFRNWLWGDETGAFAGYDGDHPDWGFVALELAWGQNYYSVVGNVLGNPSLHTDWNNATLCPAKRDWKSSRQAPVVYAIGFGTSGESPYDPTVRAKTLLHGNYDYKTRGVAYWDGGSNHFLMPSMYYSARPAFFGAFAWPPFGPDVTPITNLIPAQARYTGAANPTAPASRP